MAMCQKSSSTVSALLLVLVAVSCGSVAGAKCNWGRGQWVRDSALPRYTGLSCPHIRNRDNCQLNGRPDLDYQKYRWQPSSCKVKRFSPWHFASLLRNKVILLVGDSVRRELTQSLVCSLNSGRTNITLFEKRIDRSTVMTGYEYPTFGLRIASVTSSFLMSHGEDPKEKDTTRVDLARVDPAWASLAKGANILIFQATAWWISRPLTFAWNGRALSKYTTRMRAYSAALRTVLRHLAAIKFKGYVLLISHSPTHYLLPPGVGHKGTCERAPKLTDKQVEYIKARDPTPRKWLSLQSNVTRRTKMRLLDVTTMSMQRPDGHIQIWNTPGGRAAGGGRVDCRHWCEAGVQDMWVEAMYNKFLEDAKSL